jgi:hypothetical protein
MRLQAPRAPLPAWLNHTIVVLAGWGASMYILEHPTEWEASQQPGMSHTDAQPGVSRTHPQPGMSHTHPQPGVYPARRPAGVSHRQRLQAGIADLNCEVYADWVECGGV